MLGLVVGCTTLAGCADQQPFVDPPAVASPSATTRTPTPAPPVSELPVGALRDLVPAPQEVPAGLVPLLQASGPRDAAAVAAFSADPTAAAASLAANGFTDAYVVQYASAADPRSLSVVAVRFATADGAKADYEGDVAVGGGEPVEVETIGEASQVRRLSLPDAGDQDLITVRFRSGATTWLLAWRARLPADAAVPVAIARTLAERG